MQYQEIFPAAKNGTVTFKHFRLPLLFVLKLLPSLNVKEQNEKDVNPMWNQALL